MKRTLFIVVVALVVAEQVWLLTPLAKRWLFPARHDQAVAGYEAAERLGCFACHGPEGAGGIRNPGGEEEEVPALSGGEMMMWADSEEQLREWILYGSPLDQQHAFERSGYDAGQGSERAIVMPAFETHLSDEQLEQLLAYLKAISGLQFPADATVSKGLTLAYELGCFRCHGPMGTGGVDNPGSLKGYVPGFLGEDYAELVEDRNELRQWLTNGISDRFRASLPARAIIERQALKMPAYGRFLDDEDLDALVAAVEWLNAEAWREMPVP